MHGCLQAVIFLATHDEMGSAGFILNRPTTVQLGDLVEGDALPQFRRTPLYLGGDVGKWHIALNPAAAVTSYFGPYSSLLYGSDVTFWVQTDATVGGLVLEWSRERTGGWRCGICVLSSADAGTLVCEPVICKHSRSALMQCFHFG